MKKNFLWLGVLISIALLASCSGGSKSNALYSENPETLGEANSVINYYDLSLRVLKKVVWEKEVNAVLGYMEVDGKIPASPVIEPLMISVKDSIDLMNPGGCFDKHTQQILIDNYAGLYKSRNQFYENYNVYKASLKSKDNTTAGKILDVNYQLSIEMSEYKQNILDVLSPFVEQAEQVVLAENPLREQIMAVNRMSITMQNIVNAYGQKHVSAARMDREIIKLEKQLSAATEIPTLAGHDTEMNYFLNFLSKVKLFLKEVHKVRDNGEYSESEYEALIDMYGVSVI